MNECHINSEEGREKGVGKKNKKMKGSKFRRVTQSSRIIINSIL